MGRLDDLIGALQRLMRTLVTTRAGFAFKGILTLSGFMHMLSTEKWLQKNKGAVDGNECFWFKNKGIASVVLMYSLLSDNRP